MAETFKLPCSSYEELIDGLGEKISQLLYELSE